MKTTVEQHGKHFYLRRGSFYIGQSDDEKLARVWARADEVLAALRKLLPLVPDVGQGLYSFAPQEARDAQKLLDEIDKG